ncbi:MAG: hypothetical protein ACYCYI_06495 [Saccharofermentanales bacterium]
MKHFFKIFVVLVFVSLILYVAIQRQYNDFNIEGIRNELPKSGETVYADSDDQKIAEIKPNINESKNSILSRIYYIDSSAVEKQIQFRFLIINPMYKKSIINETEFIMENERGDDIAKVLVAFQEDFWFCQTLHLALIFNDETYAAKSGEKLTMTIMNSDKNLVGDNGKIMTFSEIDKNKLRAYSVIEFIIP